MDNEQLYYLGCKAIIQNIKGEILLLKHAKGYWDFPGGRVNYGENVTNTLLREVKEETGLANLENIKQDAMVLTSVLISQSDSYKGLILWYHTCMLKDERDIILSDEHTDYSWVESSLAKIMTNLHDIVAPNIFRK